METTVDDIIFDLQDKLETESQNFEEFTINLRKIIETMKEENDRCTIGNNEESELAEFNLFQIKKIEDLFNEIYEDKL